MFLNHLKEKVKIKDISYSFYIGKTNRIPIICTKKPAVNILIQTNSISAKKVPNIKKRFTFFGEAALLKNPNPLSNLR